MAEQDWNFSFPIVLKSTSSAEVEFLADMKHPETEDFNIPKGEISGTLQRLNDSDLQLVLKGPLPGEFVLSKSN
jgi:hypothetical protein